MNLGSGYHFVGRGERNLGGGILKVLTLLSKLKYNGVFIGAYMTLKYMNYNK